MVTAAASSLHFKRPAVTDTLRLIRIHKSSSTNGIIMQIACGLVTGIVFINILCEKLFWFVCDLVWLVVM